MIMMMLKEVGHSDECKQKISIFSLLTSFTIFFIRYKELIFLPKLVDITVSVSQCILWNKCRSPYFSVLLVAREATAGVTRKTSLLPFNRMFTLSEAN